MKQRPAYKNIDDAQRDRVQNLIKALRLFLDRMDRYGQWDEGCFYYNGRACSELQEPIKKASEALGAYNR